MSSGKKPPIDEALDHLGEMRPAGAAATAQEPVQLIEEQSTGDRLLIYATRRGVEVEFRYAADTLWMTQSQIAELFGRDRSVITKHINNIFEEGELEEESNVQKMHIAGSAKPIAIYSLDTIISVGYRVSSKQATLFRKWATAKLVQFATKGFVVDKERLKDPDHYDRVKELRDIIRDIRASEANVYREVRQICALCSDYDGNSKTAQTFYAMMQNKLLWATVNMTGPEIVMDRADARQPDMGLQTWPKENIRKTDVTIAHNYLVEAEIQRKNRLTTMLLDFFEERLDQNKLTAMAEAEAELNRFIEFNERPLLSHKGSVSRKDADTHAHCQYALFDQKRRALRQETP